MCIWDKQAEVSVAHWVRRTVASSDVPICLTLDSLTPGTHYVYQVRLSDGKQLTGSFSTPPLSPLRVAFISCHDLRPSSRDQIAIGPLIAEQKPHLIVHLGDWGYPDTTEPSFPPNSRFFPLDWENLVRLYAQRYRDPYFQLLYQLAPWAYIYDDHDYAADNTGRDYRAQYRTLSLPIGDYPFEPRIRTHAIAAYQRYFPHYPLPDPEEGLFQRFRWGDVEFFFIDNRSARTGTMRAFELGELGRYYFRPKPEITLLGSRQREWLLQSLKSSTARWKVILSGVTYNRNLQLFIHQLLSFPNQMLTFAGGLYKIPSIFAAGFIADTWAAYPADQDTLLSWCWREGIRGVFFVSGDTHIATLEDGTMGGFPEVMTGGVGKTEKRSYRLAKFLGISIFNRGGQGISSSHFRPAFGLIEFYPDSAKVRLIGVGKGELASMSLRSSDRPLPPPLWGRLTSPNLGLMFELKPTPRKGEYALRWIAPKSMPSQLSFVLYNAEGSKIWESPIAPASYWKAQKQLQLPTEYSGTCYLRAEAGGTYYGLRLYLP
ncbi:MAG: alkaline phosphatase D family protein [Bacteroidia bacterium]|nr:alkaline phosphatase D family protein [Bacteroidia bacterium]